MSRILRLVVGADDDAGGEWAGREGEGVHQHGVVRQTTVSGVSSTHTRADTRGRRTP
jgi:hypothetical protein